MGIIVRDPNRQGEVASFCVSQVYREEDDGGIKGDALLCTSTAISPEAEGVWGGEIGVKSEVEFVEANGVKRGELGGEVAEYVV